MSEWIYNGEVFDPNEEFLKDYMGFVYLITEKSTGMKYIGKKLFWNSKILPKTKTRKRRSRTKVISEWKDYYSSNETLREHAANAAEGEFVREILHLCKTKGECSYLEAMEQFTRGVLLRDDYYNGIINCRISGIHLSEKFKEEHKKVMNDLN